jgi:hypothetical protein
MNTGTPIFGVIIAREMKSYRKRLKFIKPTPAKAGL